MQWERENDAKALMQVKQSPYEYNIQAVHLICFICDGSETTSPPSYHHFIF